VLTNNTRRTCLAQTRFHKGKLEFFELPKNSKKQIEGERN